VCGGPIDYEARARSSRSPSVDHVFPRAHGGAELAPIDELRLVHYGCNGARGNRTRRMVPALPVTQAVELRPSTDPRAVRYAKAPAASVGKLATHPLGQAALFDPELALELVADSMNQNSPTPQNIHAQSLKNGSTS
jgi:hypothetical protein